MPQTRRRRRIRSSGDSTWPAQEQMPGSSSSHVAPPAAQTCVNWDDDMDDFMPPKPWPPTHDVPPPVHEPRIRKETKGKAKCSSSHVAPPVAQTCVNWDDDMDDFMPPNHGLQHIMFLPLYMNLDPEKREREREEVRQVMLQHLKHQLVLTGITTWMTLCPPKP